MLNEAGIEYRYREYTREPLSEQEIRSVLAKLAVGPREVLRRNDRAYRELGLTGEERDEQLIALMADNPTLLQRPIAVLGKRATVGRPPERLWELVGSEGGR